MVSRLQFANNATVNIAGAITVGMTQFVLPAGTGALFPTTNVATGAYFKATLEDRRTNPITREMRIWPTMYSSTRVAIAAFAGEPIETARYFPEDDRYLLPVRIRFSAYVGG